MRAILPNRSSTKMKDYFAGVLEEYNLNNPGHCGRWTIDKVQWCGKNEEYIPYADIVCYLPLEHNGFNRELGSRADYRNWAGCLPLSLELVPRLTRLDQFELSKMLRMFWISSHQYGGTELYQRWNQQPSSSGLPNSVRLAAESNWKRSKSVTKSRTEI